MNTVPHSAPICQWYNGRLICLEPRATRNDIGSLTSADQYIPTQQTEAAGWLSWYEALPGSKADRNNVFMKVWQKRGSAKANTHELRSYLKDKGISISTNGVGSITDATYGALDAIGNVLSTSGYVALGITGVVVVVVILSIIAAIKNPEATGKIVTMVATKGRAA